MSENVTIYCDDCGSTDITIRPLIPPRRVSMHEYVKEQMRQPQTHDLVKRTQTWVVARNNCGRTRSFDR